jgi:hypothetical protein
MGERVLAAVFVNFQRGEKMGNGESIGCGNGMDRVREGMNKKVDAARTGRV